MTDYISILIFCAETQYGASDSWQTFVDENGKRSDTSAFIREKDQQGLVCWDKPKSECDPKARLHIWTYKFVTKILVSRLALSSSKRAINAISRWTTANVLLAWNMSTLTRSLLPLGKVIN